jgi:hypothetical protein
MSLKEPRSRAFEGSRDRFGSRPDGFQYDPQCIGTPEENRVGGSTGKGQRMQSRAPNQKQAIVRAKVWTEVEPMAAAVLMSGGVLRNSSLNVLR